MKKNSKKVEKKSGVSGGKMAVVGAGVAAVGAGAYYLFGPKAKAHQRKASILIAKMKREATQKVAQAKSMTKPLYDKAVDTLSAAYSKQYDIHEKDIKAVAEKLKADWENVAKKVAKKTATTATRTAKKVKKTIKKRNG